MPCAGSDIMIKDDEGLTAFDNAKDAGHTAVLDIFKDVYGKKAGPGGGDAKRGSVACMVQ